ncbi:MAG: cation:proton antiporter [Candidatus Bathyarchaeota archaeon]|nr:cation:proton antiporter [Candidatus Bathyarchaeota archaeon]
MDEAIRAIITICILVFSAKVLGEVFAKIKIPAVLGELTAGMILGPYALGAILTVNGSPVIEINEIVKAFGEIGGILILFAAGLEMTFSDFRKVGATGFTVGTMGVVVPFILGYGLSSLLGLGMEASLVVGASLVATSISITAVVLQELKKIQTPEAKVIVSAAVVDDVLGLAILGVIVSFISTAGSILNPLSIVIVIVESLAIWLAMVVSASLVIPKLINLTASKGKSEETVEAAATASCFGAAALAAYIGLSPIVGAYAAGMAMASSKRIDKIRHYSKKITVIFSPVFFALAGAAFNIQSFLTTDVFFYVFFIALVIVAVVGKVVGCGGSAALFLRDKDKSLKVGIGMISRGEVGLIIAGVAVASGAVTQSIYSAIIGMIMITTVITPLLLKVAYDRSSRKKDANSDV